MATLDNVDIEDNFTILNKKYDRELLYHGDPNIIKPMKTGLQNSEGKSPLAATILGINNTSIPLPDDHNTKNYWSDHDALESYLKTEPTCYLILGSQGCGNFSLGEGFSKKNNCIHLNPKHIILDEIEQNKTTGKVIDFNLRHNKVCKYNIIFAMLKQKLRSPAIKHRGFVISGLPLIDSSTNINNVIHKLISEEAYSAVEGVVQDLLNFEKKKKKLKSASPHSSLSSDIEDVEEEEDEVNEIDKEDDDNTEVESFQLPKFLLNSCNNILIAPGTIYDAKKSIIFKQIKELFDLNPDIIINVSYPHNDLAYRRYRKYYDYMTNTRENYPFPTVSNDFEIRWSSTYKGYDCNKPIDNRVFNPKFNCKHPINFYERTFKQICNYKDHVNNYIEQKLKELHPSKILNLDGRIPLPDKLHNVQRRLSHMMTVNPVLIPEPLYLNDPPDNIDEFWSQVEKLNVIRSGVLNFNRHSSPWYNRCPVELHHRRSIQGNIKYSVTFFKYVFLMSSLNAMSLFCKNPRPYLKLNYLEPTCRVIIIGTKSSGKSMIAKCLSWIFDVPVICYTQLLQKAKQEKYNNFSKNIFSEIIATIEDKRFEKWESLESERKTKLNKWLNEISNKLNKYVSLSKKYLEEPSEIDEGQLKKFRKPLSFLPILNDLERCEKALRNHTLLKYYAPSNLITETNMPSTPAIGDVDVVQEISEYISSNNLEMDVLPTTEEIMADIINLIKSIDLKSIHNNKRFGKFIIDGFPSDPEFWEHLIQSEILPDYTIAVFESREIDSELIDHYETIETSLKSYYDRISLGTDILIKTKLRYDTTHFDIEMITSYVQLLIDNILQMSLSKVHNEDKSEDNSEKIQAFTEDISSFRENWDSLKSKLDENSKSFVEIEIEDKSDIQVLDEALLKIRSCYCRPSSNYVDEVDNEVDSEEANLPNEIISFNESRNLGETNVYCPICFYDFDILWKGKQSFSIKYDNRIHYFNSEECSAMFQNDPTKYQQYNLPFKNNVSIRICIVGCIGSGKSTLAKKIAKELGLLYIDFDYFINTFLLPRHFKKVGWKYENTFTDTSLDDDIDIEFQTDEENFDMGSEIFGNENEFRRIVQNYFEQGNPLPFTWVQILLHKLWKDTPFHNTGIVIDGFPKSLTDVENMLTCFCIPDVVIELEGNYDTTLERLSPQFSEIWKKQLSEAKLKADIELQMNHSTWTQFITSTVIAKLIIYDILDDIIIDLEQPYEQESTKSTSFDEYPKESENINLNSITIYNELIQEYPEPVDQNEWQTFDDALEKMSSRWERIFEINDENIKAASDHLKEQNIKVELVNGKKSHDNVFRKVLSKLTFIRNRRESFLEQTFVVSCDIAEMLLLEGCLFLSRFYRLCPVYFFENSSTILHTYYLSKNQGILYPVIHRSYIYFISSKENLIKFRKNPLMYVGTTDVLKSYQQYPIRIGVIGPPKSGKSKLTSKLASRYGLLCVSKGMAIRYILKEMRWTDLGLRIENIIRTGKCIDNELIMKAILIVLTDFRANTNGFVLDGFPETPYECCELLKYGIYPFIIFYLNSSVQTIEMNSQREVYYDIIKEKPPYSKPFITSSRVPVPDERFDYLCQYHKPASKVPAFLNVVDIAGLVRGAAEGQGLGNAFLSHIKACDAIFNLCRAFDDEDVIHVDGEVNPIRDLETIGEELRLKDEEQLVQNIEKLDRVVNRGNDKKLKPEYDALSKIKSILVDEKKHIRFGDWSVAEIEVLNKYLFLTSKPALYLVNLSEKDYIRKKNKWLPKLKEWIDKNDPGAPLVPFSGVLEAKLFEMKPEEKQAFLKEHNITSALDKIIVQGYKALQLEYFFTAGPDEVKAWTIQKGTKAPQAAGRIHTDFEKGFIMAEVMHFKDFKEEGTEAACKAAGKYRQQGRNYVVEDGDIIFFKFNAGAGLKDAKKK